MLKARGKFAPGFGIDQLGWALAPENLHGLIDIALCHQRARIPGDTGSVIRRQHIIKGQQLVIHGWRLNYPNVNLGSNPLVKDEPELACTLSVSVQRCITLGDRTGQSVRRIGLGFGFEGERLIRHYLGIEA